MTLQFIDVIDGKPGHEVDDHDGHDDEEDDEEGVGHGEVGHGGVRVEEFIIVKLSQHHGPSLYDGLTRVFEGVLGEGKVTIDSVPQAGRVPCHHGDTQTNKPTKRDDRVDPLIFPLHNADKAPAAPPIG